jgi:glyoxylase-like metal-dependent hydrolase (beta-lactamase superfamily II)
VLTALAAGGTKLIALRSAGFNNVDLQAAARLGLTVARVPAYSPHAVAEFTLGLLLSQVRGIHRAYQRTRDGNFALDGLLGFDLYGKTVGVVGTGRIGALVARALALGFGCRVLAQDLRPDAALQALGIAYADLPAIMAAADIVTLHCPLTPATRHMIRAETLALARPGLVLVNTSRGGLLDAEAMAQIRERASFFASMVPRMPAAYRRLMDADLVPAGSTAVAGRHPWRCIAGYGHAPEHIALYNEALGALISGDMLLPRISTNISVSHHEPEADPLAMFLASLDRLRELPADTLVLPSHGKPFQGLHARIDQLFAHHADRLAEVMAACRQAPHSAADLLPVLFRRPLDVHQTTFALGEAIAHLNALWHQGQLVRRPDAHGVWRFSPA